LLNAVEEERKVAAILLTASLQPASQSTRIQLEDWWALRSWWPAYGGGAPARAPLFWSAAWEGTSDLGIPSVDPICIFAKGYKKWPVTAATQRRTRRHRADREGTERLADHTCRRSKQGGETEALVKGRRN
jgi:hypothetical protein